MKIKKIILLFFLLIFTISCNKQEKLPNVDIDLKKIDKEFRSREYLKIKSEEIKKEKEEFKIFVVGDIMFHSPQIRAGKKENGYDFSESFEEVKKFLKEKKEKTSLVIGNFESTIAEDNFSGYPMFRTPEIAMKNIKDAGIDILALANNHSLDGGIKGIELTKKTAQKYDIKTLGTYLEDEKNTIYIDETTGKKIAILNYTYGLNGLESRIKDKPHMVNLIDNEKILDDIESAKKQNVKGIIAIMHWGNEYQRLQNKNQEELAHFMAENGVDIILGSHPHVIQPTQKIQTHRGETFVIYSLGNFLSNQREKYMDQPYSEDGLILELTVNSQDARLHVKKIKYHPTWVNRIESPLKFEILISDFSKRDKNTMEKLEKSKNRTLSHLEQ